MDRFLLVFRESIVQNIFEVYGDCCCTKILIVLLHLYLDWFFFLAISLICSLLCALIISCCSICQIFSENISHSKNRWFVSSVSPHLSHVSLIVVLWISFMFDWLAFLFVQIVLFCISIARLWLYVEVCALSMSEYSV